MILRHSFDPPSNSRLAHLCGPMDQHLRSIEAALDVKLVRRQQAFKIEGLKAAATRALEVLQALYEMAGRPIEPAKVQMMLAVDGGFEALAGEHPSLATRRADLRPRTPNQGRYMDNIAAHDITLGIGPAGTGKTFLAVACAVDALERSSVQRIILTRPAVEAGERLGFLPGDLMEKVNPYLRPLYDGFIGLLGGERFRTWRDNDVIEIVPLAYMRGRTFEDAFMILDEAQNTTPEQMKMFLTRMGTGSKAVVTGDTTQTDLGARATSGLVRVLEILKNVEGIGFYKMTEDDVMRHPLVKSIIRAYTAHG